MKVVERAITVGQYNAMAVHRTDIELGKLIDGMSVQMREALVNLIKDTCNGPVNRSTLAGLERRGLVTSYGQTCGDAARVVDMIEMREWEAQQPQRVKAAQDAADEHYANATSEDPSRCDGRGLIYLDSLATLRYMIRQAYGYQVNAVRIVELMIDGDFIVSQGYQAWRDELAYQAECQAQEEADALADAADAATREREAAQSAYYDAETARMDAEHAVATEAFYADPNVGDDCGPDSTMPRHQKFGTGYGVPYHL